MKMVSSGESTTEKRDGEFQVSLFIFCQCHETWSPLTVKMVKHVQRAVMCLVVLTLKNASRLF